MSLECPSCIFVTSTCVPSINNRFCEVPSDGTDFSLGSWTRGRNVFLAFYAISNISRKNNSGNKIIIIILFKINKLFNVFFVFFYARSISNI